MVDAFGTGWIGVCGCIRIVISILCIVHKGHCIIRKHHFFHCTYWIIGKICILQICHRIVFLGRIRDYSGFLRMCLICCHRNIFFCCHPWPGAQKKWCEHVISGFMIILISIVICSIMVINITGSISKRIVIPVCKKIRQMFFRKIICSKALWKEWSLQKWCHSKCPAHSVGFLIFHRSYVSQIRCIIVGRIRRCPCPWNILCIISDRLSCRVTGKGIKRSQLFFFFLFCQRTSFDIFYLGVFPITGSISKCVLCRIRKNILLTIRRSPICSVILIQLLRNIVVTSLRDLFRFCIWGSCHRYSIRIVLRSSTIFSPCFRWFPGLTLISYALTSLCLIRIRWHDCRITEIRSHNRHLTTRDSHTQK